MVFGEVRGEEVKKGVEGVWEVKNTAGVFDEGMFVVGLKGIEGIGGIESEIGGPVVGGDAVEEREKGERTLGYVGECVAAKFGIHSQEEVGTSPYRNLEVGKKRMMRKSGGVGKRGQ